MSKEPSIYLHSFFFSFFATIALKMPLKEKAGNFFLSINKYTIMVCTISEMITKYVNSIKSILYSF